MVPAISWNDAHLEAAKNIAEKLHKLGKKTYVVGSFCVAKLADFPVSGGDIDLTTDALPEEIASICDVIASVGKKYGTSLVREGNHLFEITTFRRDIGSVNFRRPVQVEFTQSIEEDAMRRDCTVNAIYYDLLEDAFVDPMGGIVDLHAGKMRFVGNIEDRLQEDMLRILRYVRLKNRYHLAPAEPAYHDAIRKHIPDLKNVAAERIKQELDRMLLERGRNANAKSLRDLQEIGFFELFAPSIALLRKAPGGPSHHLEGNVWNHTLLCIEALNELGCYDLDTYWALLLHDIGKYETATHDANGTVHYYRHDEIGARIFREEVAHAFKFSANSRKKIEWMIANHLRVGVIGEMHKLKAYTLMMHPDFPHLFLLAKADNLGKIPADGGGWEPVERLYEHLMRELPKAQFLTGRDIMKKYPKLSGREIGKRLKEENDRILASL